MANRLTIQVVRNRRPDTGETEYGYTAQDEYAQSFMLAGQSEDEFYAQFPTPGDLIEHVLSEDAFDDFAALDETAEEITGRVSVQDFHQ